MNALIGSLPSFDNWRLDPLADYGGSDRKTGLIDPAGNRHMIKYAEKQAPCGNLATSHVNNVVSEYVSSHILNILGYDVHETQIGMLGGEIVVACRNFVPQDGKLIEFEKFMRKRYDSSDIGKVASFRQLYDILETDPILAPQSQQFKLRYWNMFIGDALIGNFDRHKGNFGFLVNAGGHADFAPIYDNGSTLDPGLSEEGMTAVMASPKEIMRRVLLFPTAALTIKDKKIGYYDMMVSGICDDLACAIASTVPRIQGKMPQVHEFINGCGFLSSTRKEFYATMLTARMALILETAREKCMNRHFEQEARNRIQSGNGYSATDFEKEWEDNQTGYAEKIDEIHDAANPAIRENMTCAKRPQLSSNQTPDPGQ